jgi:hypothetical protein
MRNSWADLRNDYWLWRQRHGVPVPQFRACAGSEWVHVGQAILPATGFLAGLSEPVGMPAAGKIACPTL